MTFLAGWTTHRWCEFASSHWPRVATWEAHVPWPACTRVQLPLAEDAVTLRLQLHQLVTRLEVAAKGFAGCVTRIGRTEEVVLGVVDDVGCSLVAVEIVGRRWCRHLGCGVDQLVDLGRASHRGRVRTELPKAHGRPRTHPDDHEQRQQRGEAQGNTRSHQSPRMMCRRWSRTVVPHQGQRNVGYSGLPGLQLVVPRNGLLHPGYPLNSGTRSIGGNSGNDARLPDDAEADPRPVPRHADQRSDRAPGLGGNRSGAEGRQAAAKRGLRPGTRATLTP